MLEAGIGRVVIASEDPSEKASGRGPGILRDGGVEVDFAAGAEAAAARLLNQPFRKHARTGLPLVTLKLAMSLDGQTATAPGDSPWISGEQSRALVHRWRGRIRRDRRRHRHRPRRRPAAHRPRRPAPASRCASSSTPRPACRSTRSCSRPSTSPRSWSSIAPEARPGRAVALRGAGAEILVAAGATPAERIASALTELGRRGITSLFLEGGRTLAAAFHAAGQIDESRTFIAPSCSAARRVGAGRPRVAA